VLYDEPIYYLNVDNAAETLANADTVIIVGTSFKVRPFCDLIQYANRNAKILTINKEPVDVAGLTAEYLGDALDIFRIL